MASAKREIMKFEKAIKSMGVSEIKECLVKIVNFLNRNDLECFFPNVSVAIESFLVGLVSENRNLKCKLFNAECEKLASEIIESLELHRDVFGWTYAYENGTMNEDLFVYKKIFYNRMMVKPAQPKKPKAKSSVSQRLVLAQTQDTTQSDIPTGSKIQMLNTTLSFLNTDGDGVLNYPDMPLAQAQYMCNVMKSPKSDSNVGFGFKSLYAPLLEAMEARGLDYELNVSFAEKNGVASMKLEKIRRNKQSQRKCTLEDCEESSTKEKSFENSRRNHSKGSNNSLNVSLNSSTSSSHSRRRRRNRLRLMDGVPSGFVSDTMQSLLAFTADAAQASVIFEGLSDQEAAFVKGVKALAGSTSSHGSLEASLREALEQLNSNIAKVTETCKINVEEGRANNKARFIILKKIPKNTPSKPLSTVKLPTKSITATGSKDGSSKDNLIQFKSAGQLDPSTGEVEMENAESVTNSSQKPAKSRDNLNKRQAKLIEALSVPVDSDKGKRMMELMGWEGGALGARGVGILEPILPAIELKVGAGLGHVPPPKPETRRTGDFRLIFLHNVRDLLQHSNNSTLIEYKLPLKTIEKTYVHTVLSKLNRSKMPKACAKEEEDMLKLLVKEMAAQDNGTHFKVVISEDLRKLTLTKHIKPKKLKTPELGQMKVYDPSIFVISSEDREVIDDEAIRWEMASITHTSCRTPAAIKIRAMRMLFLKKFIDLVQGSGVQREFRFTGVMQKKLLAFLENVVISINRRVKCSHVADEEMYRYDQLMQAACHRECYLDIAFYHNTRFLLRKTSGSIAQQNVGNTTWPNQQDVEEQNKSIIINKIVNENVVNNNVVNNDKSGDENENPNVPIGENNEIVVDYVDNYKELTKVKCECDYETNLLVQNESLDNSFKVKGVKIQTKSDVKHASHDNIRVENVAKIQNDCDIKRKDNLINSITKDTAVLKREVKTDDTEISLSTCSDKEVDLFIFDKETEELNKVSREFGLGFNVGDNDASVSPKSDSQDCNKLNAEKTKPRGQNSVVFIVPKSTDPKIRREMYKMVQTLIWNQINKEAFAIPLLKCCGVQYGGLVYNCYDNKDVGWLKSTINQAELNLNMLFFPDDFIDEKKSRKFAIKINSFIPLDAKKVLSMIEMYNDVDTNLWKVLSYEAFDSYVIFIVELDEISFEYISENKFSLYMGIDKAQFSIIF